MNSVNAVSKNTIGDRLGSLVLKSITVVNDLFLGRLLRYSVSFSLEHTSLTVVKVFKEFNWIGWYPLSKNEVSFPPTLVPDTDLIWAETDVDDPGVIISYVGTI